VALNARFRLLAVGCTDGDIHIFSVEDGGGATLAPPVFSHTLSTHADGWRSVIHRPSINVHRIC
jgi:hypothetical protein